MTKSRAAHGRRQTTRRPLACCTKLTARLDRDDQAKRVGLIGSTSLRCTPAQSAPQLAGGLFSIPPAVPSLAALLYQYLTRTVH